LTAIPLGGSYSGAIISNVTSCSNPSNNGSARVFVDAVVTHITGGKLTFDFTVSGGGTCRLEGAFVQEGQVYRIPDGTYVCGTTFSATAQLSRIKATGEGIEGQWSAGVGGGCQEAGYFSAVLQ